MKTKKEWKKTWEKHVAKSTGQKQLEKSIEKARARKSWKSFGKKYEASNTFLPYSLKHCCCHHSACCSLRICVAHAGCPVLRRASELRHVPPPRNVGGRRDSNPRHRRRRRQGDGTSPDCGRSSHERTGPEQAKRSEASRRKCRLCPYCYKGTLLRWKSQRWIWRKSRDFVSCRVTVVGFFPGYRFKIHKT